MGSWVHLQRNVLINERQWAVGLQRNILINEHQWTAGPEAGAEGSRVLQRCPLDDDVMAIPTQGHGEQGSTRAQQPVRQLQKPVRNGRS